MDSVFIGLGFILTIGFIVFIIGRMIAEAVSNSKKPIETVRARVASKRPLVSGGSGDSSTSTTYYATFEAEDGTRTEFRVSGKDYGLLAEGDRGLLSRQGTWFKGFKRAS